MKDEPRTAPVHEHPHDEPAVFHHADVDDSTALARWLRRGLEKGPGFWLLLAGGAAVVVAVATLASGMAASKSADPEAWVELMSARTADACLKVADAHPDSALGRSALLHAADIEFTQGFDALSGSGARELAGPRLKKALDLYKRVADSADKSDRHAALAAFGIARTLEARNELPEAIKQYRLVASDFPGTPEAKRSEVMAKALEDPENVAFYKELYAYKPPVATDVPALSAPLDPTKSLTPEFLKGAPPTGATDIDPPPVTPAPAPATPPPAATPAPTATPAPAPAATPAPAPATEPAPAPKAETPK